VISEQLYNDGVKYFSASEFDKALTSFEKSIDVNATYGNVDTLAIFNAGLSAENAKNHEKAKLHYGRIIELNYPQPLVYNSLSNVYLEEQDTAKALSIVQDGRKKYPEDFNLLIAETNIYLAAKQNDKAMANLQEAVKTDPLNPTIHYAVGVNYFSMGNLEEAEKSYKKAIELKPDYFEANYNLGAMYVNQAATLIEKANKLPLSATAEYDALKLEADNVLKESIPYLEKAAAIDSSDRSTLLSLKEIYTRLNMMDKRKEVEAKLSDL
jgi:tetratricopeptide (TPR) repeat protein